MPRGGQAFSAEDERMMRRALALARRGFGLVSPNPMVGAVLARGGTIIGEGWHKRAGEAHAEVNAFRSAQRKGNDPEGATLYVTLEPCCSHGRTPPCTSAILAAGVRRVVAACQDPNPKHAGAGLRLLRKAGVDVSSGLLETEALRLNEVFFHWITERRPFVLLKCAMSLDGKIATNSGESKWITGPKARAYGMRLRFGADAILAGVNTIVRDDPALTLRDMRVPEWKKLRRIILDPEGRIPDTARVLGDENAAFTTVIVSPRASRARVRHLEKLARVIVAPALATGGMNLNPVLKQLGAEGITSVLVEGGGETHARFLRRKLANRICFFYAPLIITGRSAPKGVAGDSTLERGTGYRIDAVEWEQLGDDLLLKGRVRYNRHS